MIRKTNDPVMDKILQDLQKQIDELKKSVNSPMQKDGSHFRGKDGDMRFLKGANKKGYLEVYTADGVYTTVSDVFQLESRERMLPVFDEPTLTDGDIIAGTVRSTTSMTYARGIAGTEAGYWLGKYGTSDYRLFIGSSASKYFAYDNTDVKLVGGSVTAGAVKSSTTMTYDRGVAGTEFGYWLGNYGANDYRLFIGSSATKQFKYDNTDLTFLGGTITGGIVQTASGTGQRVVLSGATNTLTFYDSSNNATIVQGVAGASYNIDIDKPIRVQGIIYTTLGLDVGTSKLTIDSNGNVTKLNNVTYSFPSVAPTLNQILKCTNATGGVLTWSDSSVATSITVANEATDTTCFPVFVTAATGDLAPKSNAGLAFNSSTGVLASTFSGNLTGDVTGNVSGNAGTVTMANEATDTSCYILFATTTSGSLSPKTNAGITFNSSTGVLTVTNGINSGTLTMGASATLDASGGYLKMPTASGSVSGALYYNSGLKYYNGLSIEQFAWLDQTMYIGTTAVAINRGSAALALTGITSIDGNAATVTVANEASDTTCYLLFSTATSGSLAPKTNAALAFNSSTNVVTLTGALQAGGGLTLGATSTLDASGGYLVVPTASGSVTGALYYNSGLKYYNGLTTEQFAWLGADNANYLHGSRSALSATGFGVKGSTTSTSGSSYSIYGVYGEATGSANVTAIGVYGTAASGTTNWAGYFSGDTKLNGAVAVNQGTVSISSSTVAAAGKSMLRITGGSGDINTISGGVAGQIIILLNEIAGSAVTIKDAADNINSAGDFSMNTGATITLIYNSNDSKWYEMARSNN